MNSLLQFNSTFSYKCSLTEKKAAKVCKPFSKKSSQVNTALTKKRYGKHCLILDTSTEGMHLARTLCTPAELNNIPSYNTPNAPSQWNYPYRVCKEYKVISIHFTLIFVSYFLNENLPHTVTFINLWTVLERFETINHPTNPWGAIKSVQILNKIHDPLIYVQIAEQFTLIA